MLTQYENTHLRHNETIKYNEFSILIMFCFNYYYGYVLSSPQVCENYSSYNTKKSANGLWVLILRLSLCNTYNCWSPDSTIKKLLDKSGNRKDEAE